MRIFWTRLAVTDIRSARDYIAEENPSAAARVVGSVQKSARVLSRYPDIGRLGRVPGTRELVVPGTPFIISYRIRERGVEVLAVIHGARRWPESFPF